MSQITSGFRSILSKPFFYDLSQYLFGASQWRQNFINNFVAPDSKDRILDIGCGTAEILKYMPSSISYYGFDSDQNYISAAKKKFNDRGIFICANVNDAKFDNLKSFDIVLAIGVLHHLNDNEVKSLIKLAHKKLKRGGRLITADPCLTKNQNPIARFLIKNDRGQNVRSSKSYINLPKNLFYDIKGILLNRTWIPYTHWIMVCKK